MDIRTTDHVRNATQKFFEDQGLEQAVAEYFDGATVKKMISQGYAGYKQLLEKAKTTAPEGVKEHAGKVAEKLNMTEAAYEQDVYETFKEKVADIFHPASVYIPIKEQLTQLFKNQDDENLLHLLISAMEDISEYISNRFANIVVLLAEGIPMEIAEEIADEAGDAEVVPIGIKIQRVCDEGNESEEDESDEDEPHCCCNGECGGHCNCEGKDECEDDGHCQCEGGCKCSDHAD